MVSNGILDDFEELLLGSCRADGHAMEQLHHETCKAFEGSRDADGRIHFDKDSFGGMDVYLEFAGFVDWGVKKGQEALVFISLKTFLMTRARFTW